MPKTKKKKINYVAEMEEMQKRDEDLFKKEKCDSENRRKYSSNSALIIFLIVLTIFVVGAIIYATYEVVRVTHIADLAGVHVTPAIRKMTNNIMNECDVMAEMQKKPGYENWLIYKNKNFAFLYSPEWEAKTDSIVTFKKYNGQQKGGADSLAMTIAVGTFDNPNQLSLEQVLLDNHRNVRDNVMQGKVAGREALRTGKIILDSGLSLDGIYWPMEGDVIYMEAVYYDQETGDLEKDFQKVVDSVNFL
jgi:hypothetical protein